jgi:heme/copper-type cytochrome/quinol oxidase subunit 3
MKKTALDVSALPEFAFGTRDPIVWGLGGLVAIESTMIGLLVGGYFYVRGKFPEGTPVALSPVAQAAAAAELVILLASCIPNTKLTHTAVQMQLRPSRKWLLVLSLLCVPLMALRTFEIFRLGFGWDANAYASMVWAMLGLHTLHLLAGVGENWLFLFLMYRGPIEKKFMVDLHANGLYWYFVVAGWAVFYVTIYLEPLLR